MAESIIGQEQVIERLLLTLLANGNLLLEGLLGLAKTRAVKSLARIQELSRQREIPVLPLSTEEPVEDRVRRLLGDRPGAGKRA